MRMSLLVIPFKNHLHRDTHSHLILPLNDTSDDAMQDNSKQENIFDLLWMINMLLMNDCLFSRVDIVNHISSIDVVLHTKSSIGIIYSMALRVMFPSTHHAACYINKIIIVHLVDCTTRQANVAILIALVTQYLHCAVFWWDGEISIFISKDIHHGMPLGLLIRHGVAPSRLLHQGENIFHEFVFQC